MIGCGEERRERVPDECPYFDLWRGKESLSLPADQDKPWASPKLLPTVQTQFLHWKACRRPSLASNAELGIGGTLFPRPM
jgi:hypothetical protein